MRQFLDVESFVNAKASAAGLQKHRIWFSFLLVLFMWCFFPKYSK